MEIWREDLDNPHDRPRRIAASTDLATWDDTSAEGGKSYRYHLLGVGGAGLACASAPSATADATATGPCAESWPVHDPRLSATSGDASCGVTLGWNPAQPACPGSSEPIVYNVYRSRNQGSHPHPLTLLTQTADTSLVDVPPQGEGTFYYLVMAQHGVPGDAARHDARGSAQVLDWEPVVPSSSRSVAHEWTFDAGPEGWSADNTNDANGGWALSTPIGTSYGGLSLAADGDANGAGQAWVTGAPGGSSRAVEFDNDASVTLISPSWDGSTGATLLSFHLHLADPGAFFGGLVVEVDNGSETGRASFGFPTVQPFATSGVHGWQRVELDLATLVAPSATMSVRFITYPLGPFSEFGVDDVLVESATACSRPGLVLDTASIDDSEPGWGNGNGMLEPGETARVSFTLRNVGGADAIAPLGTLRAMTPGVLVHEAEASFPDIAVGGTGASSGPGFTVSLPASTACATTPEFRLDVRDDSGELSRELWQPELGDPIEELVFEDDFETDKGWTVSGAGAGQGVWQRGVPVGTLAGSEQANPATDSPFDTGEQCFVTENGEEGGAADLTDVDATSPELRSPAFDLSPYKRASVSYDRWYFDDSFSTDFFQDYGLVNVFVDDPTWNWNVRNYDGRPTDGWKTMTLPFHTQSPLLQSTRVYANAIDRDESHYQGATASIVEFGLDNVRVTGTRLACAATGIENPPLGIGDTLRITGKTTLTLTWQASPTDPTHDAAAWYELHRSSAPAGGFTAQDTTTETSLAQNPEGLIEYFRITAHNASGESDDKPAP